ncbi:hypothetical protein AMK59_5031 [Oryctes borbonicus]|uniref:DUF4460 domain-containing protein n=1 Tax=Oryctes borbonicus TaxID=1629725 RepID=A0A0T6B406_9SCAR|nr:hypothetical protein AMK59_5031 [Oryctes borbonicus]
MSLYTLAKWRSVQHSVTCLCHRNMTTTEVSTALRPFYFSVHPDLFGQYPQQRTTNENSLKLLSSYIESIQSRRFPSPCSLQFYIRPKQEQYDIFKLIKIILKENDIRKTVLTLLKSCDLPTEYVDKIPEERQNIKVFEINYRNMSKIDPIFGPIIMQNIIKEERETQSLLHWLKDNYLIAIEKSNLNRPLRKDVDKLKKIITNTVGVSKIIWDCGWNEMHFRGCLQSFIALAEQNPEPMHILKDRVLVFAPFTGVSLDGHIMLYTGEVRHNWLDLIKKVRKYDEVLLRIPGFEKTVSQVLRDIKVVRRKFMPKILAGEYERQLQQLTTSLSDYHGLRGYPKHWPKSLSNYEIVVETEAGPLMVSPTGQFIVPSSCPGSLLVNFLSEHMEEAASRLKTYTT